MRYLQLWFLDRSNRTVLFRQKGTVHVPPVIIMARAEDPLWWVEEMHDGVDLQLGKKVGWAIMTHCRTTEMVHTYGVDNDDVYAYLAKLPADNFIPDNDKAVGLIWKRATELNSLALDPYHRRVAEKCFAEL